MRLVVARPALWRELALGAVRETRGTMRSSYPCFLHLGHRLTGERHGCERSQIWWFTFVFGAIGVWRDRVHHRR